MDTMQSSSPGPTAAATSSAGRGPTARTLARPVARQRQRPSSAGDPATWQLFPDRDAEAKALRRQLHGAIRFLVGLIGEKRGRYAQHAENVANLAYAVGSQLGLDRTALEDLKTAALIHDLGMLRLPELQACSRWHLTPEERGVFETHPEIGAEMAELIGLPDAVCAAVRHHHEHRDGTGFPHGLTAEEIPLAARIIAACDTFDQMTCGRSSIEPVPLTCEEALEELGAASPAEYDSEFVAALENVLGSSAEIAALTGMAH